MARGVHIGHFRRFATEKRAVALLTPVGNAPNNRCRSLDVQRARGEVIQKEQGLGPLYQHIVDAHRDQIDTNRFVARQVDGELELGADAIGGRNEHGIAPGLVQFEQSAKAAQSAHHTLAQGGAGRWLDTFDEVGTCIDIDAGIAVAERSVGVLCHGRMVSTRLRRVNLGSAAMGCP